MVLTVAALVAAMMVSAGPAQAQANEADFENSTSCFQSGDETICGFGDDGDVFGFGDSDDVALLGIDPFDSGFGFVDNDDDFGEGKVRNSVFGACPFGCDVGDFDLGEIETNVA